MGFDNQYEKGKSSRLLIVQVYEDAQYANIVWEFKVGAYTPEYGDNDRMPTGNLLTCYWVEDFDVDQWEESGDADEQFDARVQEIVRSTKLPAWRASVQGPVWDEGKREKQVSVGTFHFNAHWRPTRVHADLIC